MRADFHLHTWCSDGSLAPAALSAAVAEAGLRWWAVTDHDSLAGWRACAALGLPGLVPGVEVSGEQQGREVHVVGLGVDPADAGLEAFLAGIRARRLERLAAIIARLPREVTRGLAVADLADGRAPEAGDSLSRTHLARALVARGGVGGFREAFSAWLSDQALAGAGLPAFPDLDEVGARIRAAGGVAILAHPGIYRTHETVCALMGHGLDGLEVEHPGLESGLAQALRAEAPRRGWLQSVGSDFHASGGPRRPGCCRLGAERLAPLMERLGLREVA